MFRRYGLLSKIRRAYTLACGLMLPIIVSWTVLHAQTFRVTVDHVVVPVTVVSDRSEPTADLEREDFRVFDNGRSVPIVSFGNFQAPIHILFVLDTSSSMLHSLPEAKAAVAGVLSRLRPRDSVQIGTFSNSLQLSPVLSADDSELLSRLVFVPGANATGLYDVLLEGFSVFGDDVERRTMFIVSDGMDTASSASARTVMERAAAANVTIYAIGLSSRTLERGKWIVRAPDSTLRGIAEDSGGGTCPLEKVETCRRYSQRWLKSSTSSTYWRSSLPISTVAYVHSW